MNWVQGKSSIEDLLKNSDGSTDPTVSSGDHCILPLQLSCSFILRTIGEDIVIRRWLERSLFTRKVLLSLLGYGGGKVSWSIGFWDRARWGHCAVRKSFGFAAERRG